MAGTRQQKVAKKPVRRARQARSKATVQAIIEAATRILAEQGWDALNTNAIAERAGVSVGSVYEYFPNKQAIVDEILNQHLEQGHQIIEQGAGQVSDKMTSDDAVQLLVAGFVSIHADDPRLHRVLSNEIPLTRPQRDRIEALRRRIIELVTLALAETVESVNVKATLLVDTADALTHRWLVDEVGMPVDAKVMAAEMEKMLKLYIQA